MAILISKNTLYICNKSFGKIKRNLMEKSIALKGEQNSFMLPYVTSETYNKSDSRQNYAFSSNAYYFVSECITEKDFDMLKRKEIKAEKTDTGGYIVKSKDGKMLTFLVE